MALVRLVGAKVAGSLAQREIRKAGKISVEQFGYNFVNLGLMLMTYFIISFAIAKYFEAVILGKGIINDLAKLLGFTPTFPENENVRKLFVDGFGDQKIVYWDLIKGIAIILVIIEWQRFNDTQKAVDGKTSPITHGIFSLIVGLLTVITIPKVITTIKTINQIQVNT